MQPGSCHRLRKIALQACNLLQAGRDPWHGGVRRARDSGELRGREPASLGASSAAGARPFSRTAARSRSSGASGHQTGARAPQAKRTPRRGRTRRRPRRRRPKKGGLDSLPWTRSCMRLTEPALPAWPSCVAWTAFEAHTACFKQRACEAPMSLEGRRRGLPSSSLDARAPLRPEVSSGLERSGVQMHAHSLEMTLCHAFTQVAMTQLLPERAPVLVQAPTLAPAVEIALPSCSTRHARD